MFDVLHLKRSKVFKKQSVGNRRSVHKSLCNFMPDFPQ